MENPLTRHCKMLDYFKNLLFNATTSEQEARARKLIEFEEKQEKYLYINKELSTTAINR